MYTIGRLARRAKVKVDSIRFYERQALLAPASKTPSGYRLYTDEALRRLTFIKHAQRCGFSLSEIGALLEMHNGDSAARTAVYRLALRKQTEIRDTMEALENMSHALAVLLSERPEPTEPAREYTESPVLAALDAGIDKAANVRDAGGKKVAGMQAWVGAGTVRSAALRTGSP